MQVIGLHIGGSFAEASVWAKGEAVPRAKSVFYLPRHPLKNALPSFLKTLPDPTFAGAFVTSRYLERLFDYRLGGSTAQIVTAGFERWSFLNAAPAKVGWIQPTRSNPISSLEHSLPVAERIDATGAVLVPLTMESLVPIATKLKAQQIRRVCVHFLHANINPVHEKMAASWLREQGFEVWTPPPAPDLDEGSRWRASTLEASFAGTFEESRSEMISALTDFVPETSVKIHDGQGFKNFNEASKVGTLFADDALLARQKKYPALVTLELDHWSLWQAHSTKTWASPWGTVACEGPKRRPLVVQPSSALELAGPESIKAGEKAEGFEPGPLSLGRGRKPMTFDLWATDDSIQSSLSEQINAAAMARRDSALLTLSRETKNRGTDAFLKSIKSEISRWIASDIALDVEHHQAAKIGRMARALDQVLLPMADLPAGPSDRVALAALEDLF